MNELINYIKNNTNNVYEGIKIVSVIYNKEINSVEVKVVYKSDFNFSVELRNNLCDIIKNFIGVKGITVDLKTKKSLLDKSAIYDLIAYYLQKNYASIFATINKEDVEINIDNQIVAVKLNVISVFYNYLLSRNFASELKSFLERNYFQSFICELGEAEAVDNLEEELNEHEKQFNEAVVNEYTGPQIVYYEVSNVEPFVGNPISETKVPALSFITSAKTGIVVAGETMFLTKKSFTSKRKNQNGEFEEREFYSFTIGDGYGKLQCVYFPTKDTKEKLEELQNGQKVLIFGDIEDFNQRLSLKVKSISLCTIPPKEEEKVQQKFENDKYLYITPEPYISMVQSNLFDIQVDDTIDILKNNDFVVFDLETTGLEASTSEIIEIGACKVHNGKITETFSCLIKPTEAIPAEITNLTGITNDMVKDSYSIKEVLQDFYKFTRNSVLVAYNIAFDYKFIYLAGNAQGYIFDNKQIDCMVLAKTKLRGLKNYKLKTVVTHLNIPLDNAHRAVHDATATAEAFIKLADNEMM